MRQDRTIALVDTLAYRSEAVSNLADLFGGKQELLIRGLNSDALSDADEATFYAMIEAVESYFVSIWVRVESNGGQAH
jgi:hypothetical protein